MEIKKPDNLFQKWHFSLGLTFLRLILVLEENEIIGMNDRQNV